jgi:glycosyltransferase involved in cell wall biosynthesis
LEQKIKVIATVINDVIYDQRMIRICSTLSESYDVELWGRRKSKNDILDQPYHQRRFRFIVNGGFLFYLAYNLRIFLALLFNKFDVIHAVDLDTLPAGFLACKIKRKKIVYDSHEYFTEVPELVSRSIVRGIWLLIERMLVPKVNAAITVGNNIAEIYTKKYNIQFHVIRNCTESKIIKEEVDKRGYILYQGALNKGRGLEALIISMKTIPLKLKIAGSGDIDQKLKKIVAENHLSDKIEFLGLIEPQELSKYTSFAFIGYNVMENMGLSYYYSLSNKFFDYIHSEVPVITNQFPEYNDINITYNCCVFADAIPKEISKSVNALLNDPKSYQKLKINCKKATKELNWGIEKKKLTKLYNDLI